MGRLLRFGVLAVALAVIALAGAPAAFAVEPINPPNLSTDCASVAPDQSFCVRVFPICRPGPTCPGGVNIINNDQFVDDDPIRIAKPFFLWLPATVTNDAHAPLVVTGATTHLYCYSTEPGPDRPNVVQITTAFASYITSIGPSNRLCVPAAKTEL
jgi:hypothetical protein